MPRAKLINDARRASMLACWGIPGISQQALMTQWPEAAHVDGMHSTPDMEQDTPSAEGQFISGKYTNEAGSRDYKLYIPASYDGEDLPLLVMLHGCRQDPDDFANATKMNRIAEQQPCFVVYPAQCHRANDSGCWNWYAPVDQRRGEGEPSIIAGITRSVAASYPIDASRIYIAGLSAGGAMAAIMGKTYPDLYAAVGIHSGLPPGVAHDMLSAYDAMLYGAAAKRSHEHSEQTLPMIIFHGDRDATVHPANADRLFAQAAAPECCACGAASEARHTEIVLPEQAEFGRYAYTRTIRLDEHKRVYAEQWLLHGAGHAWSGGNLLGSFADAKGPDASVEMMRFFANLSRCGQCRGDCGD